MTSEPINTAKLLALLSLLSEPNRLVLLTSVNTGCRVGDVLNLRTDTLLRTRRPTITEQKTGKNRRIYIPADLHEALLAQASLSIGCIGTCPAPVRPSTRTYGRPQSAFASRSTSAPHSMRKIYAKAYYTRTRSIERLRLDLNHDRVETTLGYLNAGLLGKGGR